MTRVGPPLHTKGQPTRPFRTLFGTFTLPSPRVYHCPCQQTPTTTFRPLTAPLTEPTAPELMFMETTWASLVSYGLTVQALKSFLPVDAELNIKTVQNHTLAVVQRWEDELGEEQWAFVEGCPADWETLQIPDGPITDGIDGAMSAVGRKNSSSSRSLWGRVGWPFTGKTRRICPPASALGLSRPWMRSPNAACSRS